MVASTPNRPDSVENLGQGSSDLAHRIIDELIAQYGAPEENPSFWAEISANTYVQDLSEPLQLHHGTADTSVPIEFSETLFEQIKAAGGEGELHIYEGDNHNISNSFGVAMRRSIKSFDARPR